MVDGRCGGGRRVLRAAVECARGTSGSMEPGYVDGFVGEEAALDQLANRRLNPTPFGALARACGCPRGGAILTPRGAG
jgi:hypothetical protein